ncbi:hypothetical protein [Streptomyces sp. NBC_00539]|nr:hypothetical protein [Streptomyces sp. NBC_00539]WUC62785.1 hypothetical protein OG861_00290 [Streptomyces sp. NBC_00539]
MSCCAARTHPPARGPGHPEQIHFRERLQAQPRPNTEIRSY